MSLHIKYCIPLRKGKIILMGFKLDMTKAYDYIEKDYIEVTLQAFGFHKEFTRIKKECVSSMPYSIPANGSPFGKIISLREVRQ